MIPQVSRNPPNHSSSGSVPHPHQSMSPPSQADNRHRWRCNLDWRWGSYWIASFLSFLILAVAQKSGDVSSNNLPITSLYFIWIFSMLVFASLNYDNATTRGIFHFLCCATSLFFFSSICQITSDQLHLWIPISTTCGIFMAEALIRGASCCCTSIRRWVLDLLRAAPGDIDPGYGPLLPTATIPPIKHR